MSPLRRWTCAPLRRASRVTPRGAALAARQSRIGGTLGLVFVVFVWVWKWVLP